MIKILGLIASLFITPRSAELIPIEPEPILEMASSMEVPINLINNSLDFELLATSSDNIDTSTEDIVKCSCVRFARTLNPNIPLKDAKDLVPNGSPEINGGILFKYSNGTYHVGIIKAFLDNGFQIVEANYFKCKIGERMVEYNDKFIIGFIN